MPSPPSPPRPDADAQRIAKLLARAGVASRREVERMIAEGRVALNGVPLDTPATILPSLAGVTVDGESVEAPAAARLFLYHKPAGLLVTERDPAGRATIYDRLPGGLPRVVPVGRLDLGTEGLLLLTTDGGLKRQLELPATGVERVYRARAYGAVTQGMLEDLITGIEIEGVRYGPIDANLERRTGANVWIEMKLTEGKNREVRRVLDHLGLSVSRLIRTRYGPFVLGDLAPGAVVEVRTHDIESFRKNPTRIDLPQPARQRAPQPEPVAIPMPGGAGRRPPAGEAAPRAAGPARANVANSAPRPTRATPERPPRAGGPAAPARTMPRPPAPSLAGPPHGRVARDEREADRGRPPAAGKARGPRGAGAETPMPGGVRPKRGPGRARDAKVADAPVAKPARAARARAFRDASGPAAAAAPLRQSDRKPSPRKPEAGASPPRSGGPATRPPEGRGTRPPRRPGR